MGRQGGERKGEKEGGGGRKREGEGGEKYYHIHTKLEGVNPISITFMFASGSSNYLGLRIHHNFVTLTGYGEHTKPCLFSE